MAQMQLFYLTKNGQSLGPFSALELKEMAAAGLLEPADLLWTEGWSEWKPVGTTSLGQHLPPAPLPPPPSPVLPATPTSPTPAGDTLSQLVGQVRGTVQSFLKEP
jgi:hypothetical protein